VSQAATELLVGASTDFLKRFAPFRDMEAAALDYLGRHALLAFHPRDSEVLTPAMGEARHLCIVRSGRIRARRTEAEAIAGHAALTMGPGDCFPIGALSARRPSTHSYVAVDDSFCFQLGAEEFVELMRMSPVFQVFCTQHVARLLNQSRQQLQAVFSQRAAEQQGMTTPLGQLIGREAVRVAPETSTRAALERMNEAGIGSIVVADAERRPLGILTRADLLPRIVLPGFDLSRPVAEVMTADPHRLPAGASAYDAVLAMATHGVGHLLVVDGDDRLRGVVSERDLFSLQRISLRQIRAAIDGAGDIEMLRQAGGDIRRLALNLIAQGVGAEQLTRFISALNDALTRRVIALALDRHDLYGIDFAWFAFGSEGRHEQTLSSDQDNGLIWQCPEMQDAEPIRLRLLAFAREVNEDLAACGFPLCKGNIMAGNPALCLTSDEWMERFDAWIREPDPQALLNATIFFDFRVLYGDEQFGRQLRRWLDKATRGNPAFLRMMAINALQVAPPLGRLRDFVVEDDGTIDLKKSGARLFVDAARIIALRTGVEPSSTVQRLRQAASRSGITADEVAAMVEGFHFIQMLRLRAQQLRTPDGTAGDNRVDPDTLNELDRRVLKEAFRQARKLQLRLKLDYQL
jgi:CBS domain-containing protein